MTGAICIVDTSVFLNLLNVPGRNQGKASIQKAFLDHAESGATFVLPMATVLETGNHVARCGDGGTRRNVAKRFCKVVKAAIDGEAPFTPSEFPSSKDMLGWIEQFPDLVGKNWSSRGSREGASFGDLSIIEEYNKCAERFPMSEVFIWSLDSDLQQYHRNNV